MRADQAVWKQLAARLKRLRRRAADTAAEIEMVERLMADVENRAVNPGLKLRKNGVAKLSVQGGIKRLMAEAGKPMRAKDLLEGLRAFEPSLNASTFRSHLRRMVDAGIIARDGPRGLYKPAQPPPGKQTERYYSRRKLDRPEYSYE